MITKYTYISTSKHYIFRRDNYKVLKDIGQKYSLSQHIVIMDHVSFMTHARSRPQVINNIYLMTPLYESSFNKWPIFVDKYQQESLRNYGRMRVKYFPIKVVGYTLAAVDSAISEIDLITSNTNKSCQISVDYCDPKIVGIVIKKDRAGLRQIEDAIGNGSFIYYSNHKRGPTGGSFIIEANSEAHAVMTKISLEERIATIYQRHVHESLVKSSAAPLKSVDIMNGEYDWW